MRDASILLVGLMLAVLPLAGPANAFHGTPWSLDGVAVFGPTGQEFNVTLAWSNPAYRFAIVDDTTGLPLVSLLYNGVEQTPFREWTTAGPCRNDMLEVVYPHSGQGAGPTGALVFSGVQENCLWDGSRYVHAQGVASQFWSFEASLGEPFGTLYES